MPLSSVDHGPAHLNSPANTYYQSPPSDDNSTLFGDATLGQGAFGTQGTLPSISMVDSVSCLRCAEFPVPPITLRTDMVARFRLLAAHGLGSCLSVRTQPLTATGAPSQTSTMPCHAMPWPRETPFTEGCGGVNYQTLPPWPLEHAVLLVPLRSVQP